MKYYSSVKEAISDSGSFSFMNGKSIKLAESSLNDDERITAAVTAVHDKISGVFVVTTKRVLFCASSMGDTKRIEINILDIKSIKTSKINTKFEIITNHLELQLAGIRWHQFDELKNIIEESKKQLLNVQNNPKDKTNISVDTKALTDLKSLYDNGVITEEEFKLKKKKILGI